MIDFMNEAIALAKKAASEDEVPIGAVVVHQGQIIAFAHNRREQDQDPLAHAEIIALKKASEVLKSWRLLECELYVTLEPCPMCLGASQQARVKKVVYGAQDPKGGALSLGYSLHSDERLNHRFEVTYSPQKECETLLKDFFKKKRKSDEHSS